MLGLMPDLGRGCVCEDLQFRSGRYGGTIWLIRYWTNNWLWLGYLGANAKAPHFQPSLTVNYAHKIGEHFAKVGLGLSHLSAGLQLCNIHPSQDFLLHLCKLRAPTLTFFQHKPGHFFAAQSPSGLWSTLLWGTSTLRVAAGVK